MKVYFLLSSSTFINEKERMIDCVFFLMHQYIRVMNNAYVRMSDYSLSQKAIFVQLVVKKDLEKDEGRSVCVPLMLVFISMFVSSI